MAFDILSKIASFIDLPEAVEMVRASSGKARSVEARHAAAFLEEDFRERDLCPDEATTEELLALAERTDRRSTTSRRWDYSSKPGQSASWRQLNRLDEWKGEHFRGSRSC
ncbi:MAG: hypothetical protein M5U12_07470 [Verrucomicrobia bacterium]|nr:hypothetical protein [Verrucomicrobiota bacterium]